VQVDYSPFVLDIENLAGTDLLTTCRDLGVTVVAAMPLGRGMITSTFASGETLGDSKDNRVQIMPRFMEANRDQNMKVISQFKGLADKKGCTTAQLALAWLMKQGNDIIPIPGTKQLKYLEENWAALDIDLTDAEEAEIRYFVNAAQVSGPALPPMFADYNFRDTKEEE
jgi:aryl-alcohol dehydrogenase-like predicted oxidoreductase